MLPLPMLSLGLSALKILKTAKDLFIGKKSKKTEISLYLLAFKAALIGLAAYFGITFPHEVDVLTVINALIPVLLPVALADRARKLTDALFQFLEKEKK